MDKTRVLQAIRQGTADPFVACRYLDLKPDAPDPPDYAAAANAQGAANLDAALASGLLSNPQFSNPYGSRTVEYDPTRSMTLGTGENARTVPGINITDTLSPAEQAKLDQNNALSLAFLNTANTGIGRVNDTFQTPFDSSNLPKISTPMGPEGLQVVSDALLARLEPQFERQREMLRTQLVNQGFTQGTEGYDQRMDEHNRGLNDARLAALAQASGAQQASYGMESNERNRALQEALTMRNLPLSEVNALRTGSQPTLPQFQAYSGQNVAAAPLYQATADQYMGDLGKYNAEAAATGNFTGGLFDLGSAWLGA